MPTAVVVGDRKFEVRKEGASIHLMASGGASVPLLVIDENLVLFSNGMVVASVRREATIAELHFGSGEVVVLRPETGELRLQGLSEGECRGEMRAQHGARGCLLTKFECPVPELLAAVLPLVAFFHAPRFVRQPRNLALRELDRRADVG